VEVDPVTPVLQELGVLQVREVRVEAVKVDLELQLEQQVVILHQQFLDKDIPEVVVVLPPEVAEVVVVQGA
jgi:hypothetical protein